jgi:hypothetical protein
MPTMADITIKKNDGVTDIVWNNAGAGGGDGVPAQWRPSSVGTSVQKRPVAKFWTQSSDKQTNVSRFTTTFPVVDSVSGAVLGYITTSEEVKVPTFASDTDVNEAIAQSGNLRDHALIVSSFQTRTAPR